MARERWGNGMEFCKFICGFMKLFGFSVFDADL